MERPYVICHILSSLDGKKQGRLLRGRKQQESLVQSIGRYRTEMNARSVTVWNHYNKGYQFPKSLYWKKRRSAGRDFVADDRADLYFVSVDVDGEIGWESGIFCNKGRATAHVIEVLTASTRQLIKPVCGKQEFPILLQVKRNWTVRLDQ